MKIKPKSELICIILLFTMSIIDTILDCEECITTETQSINTLMNELNDKCDIAVLVESLSVIKESFSVVNLNDIDVDFKNKIRYLLNCTLNNHRDLFLAIIHAVYKGFSVYKLINLVTAFHRTRRTPLYSLTDSNNFGCVNTSTICYLRTFYQFKITSKMKTWMMPTHHQVLKYHFSRLSNNGSLTKAAIAIK
jgi:hypothetical protein